MTSPRATKPDRVVLAPGEVFTYSVALTNQLPAGSTPTLVSTKLVDRATRTAIALPDAPVVSGVSISQRVPGTLITVGHQYRLTFAFTPSGTTNVMSVVLIIDTEED